MPTQVYRLPFHPVRFQKQSGLGRNDCILSAIQHSDTKKWHCLLEASFEVFILHFSHHVTHLFLSTPYPNSPTFAKGPDSGIVLV